MSLKYLPRCWCGCAWDVHDHYRPGKDCGRCGPQLCYGYARSDVPMPAGHTLAAALSEANTMRNLAVLTPFGIDRHFDPAVRRILPRPRGVPSQEYRGRGRR